MYLTIIIRPPHVFLIAESHVIVPYKILITLFEFIKAGLFTFCGSKESHSWVDKFTNAFKSNCLSKPPCVSHLSFFAAISPNSPASLAHLATGICLHGTASAP